MSDPQLHSFSDRSGRYSGSSLSLIPFFHDTVMQSRMDMIRESIYHIRKRWNDYDQLIDDLEEFIYGYALKELFNRTIDGKEIDLNQLDWNELRDAFHHILQTKRNWIDLNANEVDEHYTAIKYYTNNTVYNVIFFILNEFFRTDDLERQRGLLDSAVFLVELINIDLYNYVKLNDHVNNYTGTVYRGIQIPENHDTFLRELSLLPALERRISVPLALSSASTSLAQAVQFSNTDKNLKPVLFRIRVESLDQAMIDEYNRVFPESKISSICAVPIQELSSFNQEEEVLLRGPFFHLLHAYSGTHERAQSLRIEQGGSLPEDITIYDLIMVNINRDHPSVTSLGPRDKMARDAIINMVNITRMKYAMDYASNDAALAQDLEHYQRQYEKAIHGLDDLRNEWE